MEHGFSYWDFGILGIYFLIVLAVSIKYSGFSTKGVTQQFLAGRSIGWFVIGSSLFITTVSSEHVIGYPDSGYSVGFVAGNFAISAGLIVIVLGWFFVPLYIKSQVHTIPEFIERRFGAKSRWLLSILTISIYIITKISVTLFAGSLLLEALLGWDKYTASLALVIVTGVFAIAGGLKGIMYSHVFHAYALIITAGIVTIVGIVQVGGFEALSVVPASHFKIIKPVNHADYPWTGMILGGAVLNIWYWCTDYYMVQRVMSANNIANARRGALFSGFLMLLVPFLLLVPGVLVYAQYGAEAVDGKAYITFVSEILPTGVKALAIASLLSALVSSLAASFNSTSALFTIDIYKKLYPRANEFMVSNIGKIAIIVIVNISIVWITFINYFSSDIIKHLQEVQSFIAPPFAAVFLVGILWPRANAFAAYMVMAVGAVLGCMRIIVDIYSDSLIPGGVLHMLVQVNFLHQTFAFFVFYVFMMVVVSLLTEVPYKTNVKGLTYKFRHSTEYVDSMPVEEYEKRRKQDIVISVVLAAMVLGIWALFIF